MQSFGRAVARAARGVARGGSTPTRLRAWMVGTAVLAVLFGVLAAIGVGRRDASLGDAHSASQQLIAVQDVQVRLVHAEAIARGNYLRGGIENAADRATYETELAAVSNGLVIVGNQVLPNEAAKLATVSADLGRYAGLVEQARANNRQGYPIGAAYLRAANEPLAAMVATLRDVQVALRHQVNDSLDRADRAGAWLHLLGWPLMVVLMIGGGWVALRFRRLVNLPLAVAAGLTLLLLVIGGKVQGSAMTDAEAATASSLQAADLAAQARSAAFDAHAQEYSTLIARGTTDDTPWQTASATASLALDHLCSTTSSCGLSAVFESYATAHAAVRAADVGGDWDGARASSLDGAASTSFKSFDTASSSAASDLAQQAASSMSTASNGLGALRVVVFLAGLVVAALALAGYGQRLKEYR